MVWSGSPGPQAATRESVSRTSEPLGTAARSVREGQEASVESLAAL